MSVIESNITIDMPDGADATELIASLRYVISQLNGKVTHLNVVEVDDPLSLSPITIEKLEE